MSNPTFSHGILAQLVLQAPQGAAIGLTLRQAAELIVEFTARQAPPMTAVPQEIVKDVARWRFIRDTMIRFPTKQGDIVAGVPWLYSMCWHSVEEQTAEKFDKLIDQVMENVATVGFSPAAGFGHVKGEPTSEPTRTENPPDTG